MHRHHVAHSFIAAPWRESPFMKIAILGALGFLGKNLAQSLIEQGHDVTGFVLKLPKTTGTKIKYESVSGLLDPKYRTQDEFDVCINLAARRSTRSIPLSSEEVRKFTFSIPQEFITRTASPQTLVLNASTYIQNFQGVVGQTVDSYGAAKQELSEFLRTRSENEFFRTLDLFLFTIYGPGDQPSHLVPSLLYAAKTGLPMELSAGYQLMNLTYIEDVVANFSRALIFSSDKHYEKRFLWGQEYLTVRNLVSIIEETIGREIKCKWGVREYAGHEMMDAWSVPMDQFPGFSIEIPLIEGIKKIWAID